MRKKSIWMIVFCITLTVSSVVGCAPSQAPSTTNHIPAATTPPEINWNMNAMLIREDGTVVETFSLPVSGTITDKGADADYFRYWFTLNTEFPKSVPYRMSPLEPDGEPIEPLLLDWYGAFVSRCFCLDLKTGSLTSQVWGVNLEKQYFISYWGPEYGLFLVASVDPNVTAQEITAHFDELMEFMKTHFTR